MEQLRDLADQASQNNALDAIQEDIDTPRRD